MQKKTQRSKMRIAVIGALAGTIMSVGAVAGDVSAKSPSKTSGSTDPTLVVGVDDGASVQLYSGIRW